MARPRLPKLKAEVSGAVVKDPGRHAARRPPKVADGVGLPPSWMSTEQATMWTTFAAEVPWLNVSHRSVLEIAVTIRARLAANEEVGVQALNLLRQCLGQLGATPADASKVTMPDGDEEDPEDRLYDA